MSLNQLNSAQDYIKKAEKAIKKGFFSSPDFSIGAQYFEQAANILKSLQKYDLARDQFIRASECFQKANSLFMAGKQIEQAASMSINLQQYDQAGQLFQKSASYYTAHGSSDTACQVLENGAKHLETKNLELSIAMLTEAAEIYHNDDRLRFSIDCYRKLVQLLMKSQKYDQLLTVTPNFKTAAKVLTNKGTLFQIYLSEMIIHLSNKDEIAAKKVLDAVRGEPGFNTSMQAKLMSELIASFEEGDQEVFTNTVKANSSSFLDNETARLAALIRVPGAVAKPALPPQTGPTPTTSSDYPIPAQLTQLPLEAEEEDDDLC